MKIDAILMSARQEGHSDIHFGTQHEIMVRMNGSLEKLDLPVTSEETKELIYSMLNNKQIEELEIGHDLDFVYTHDNLRYRVNVYHERGHICAALRVIYDKVRSLEELNLPPILKKLTNEPRGLVLLTGPTGSGKSTTLAAMINEVNKSRSCHILTIEDPIEYVYQQEKALIHQREIGFDVDSFDTALRSAMREDPDVILVGEMRDYETIQAVLTLAETGHLVFSTLHTVGAAKTIDRIIDVFPSEKQAQVRTQLSGVLKSVITQQLLPRTDGRGRIAALEIMVNNSAIGNLIRENKIHQINSLIQTGASQGMLSLNNALAQLVRSHTITMEDAMKYSDNETELRTLI